MQFDARAVKLLKPGEHMTIADHPGLRLECTASRRAWIYHYKSPVDGRMKQTKIGAWPAMSPAAAIVEREKLGAARDSRRDVAAEKRTSRTNARGRKREFTARRSVHGATAVRGLPWWGTWSAIAR